MHIVQLPDGDTTSPRSLTRWLKHDMQFRPPWFARSPSPESKKETRPISGDLGLSAGAVWTSVPGVGASATGKHHHHQLHHYAHAQQRQQAGVPISMQIVPIKQLAQSGIVADRNHQAPRPVPLRQPTVNGGADKAGLTQVPAAVSGASASTTVPRPWPRRVTFAPLPRPKRSHVSDSSCSSSTSQTAVVGYKAGGAGAGGEAPERKQLRIDSFPVRRPPPPSASITASSKNTAMAIVQGTRSSSAPDRVTAGRPAAFIFTATPVPRPADMPVATQVRRSPTTSLTPSTALWPSSALQRKPTVSDTALSSRLAPVSAQYTGAYATGRRVVSDTAYFSHGASTTTSGALAIGGRSTWEASRHRLAGPSGVRNFSQPFTSTFREAERRKSTTPLTYVGGSFGIKSAFDVKRTRF